MYEIKKIEPPANCQSPMSVPYIIFVQQWIGNLLKLNRQ